MPHAPMKEALVNLHQPWKSMLVRHTCWSRSDGYPQSDAFLLVRNRAWGTQGRGAAKAVSIVGICPAPLPVSLTRHWLSLEEHPAYSQMCISNDTKVIQRGSRRPFGNYLWGGEVQ